MQEFDAIIVGAGQAGIPLAATLADARWRVAICERKDMGGSCINFGCTPTKAAIASAKVAHLARRASEFGIKIPNVEVDFQSVLSRARHIAAASRAGVTSYMAAKKVNVVRGQARFVGRDEAWFALKVNEEQIRSKRVIINTGARTRIPPIEGIGTIPFLHAGNWLPNHPLPQHLIFIGAGYIGLEMAQFYCRMGSAVTVVGSRPHVVDSEDEDVSVALQAALEAEGIKFELQSRARKVARENGGLRVEIDSNKGMRSLSGTHIFVAAGRQPNTDDLGLDSVGIMPQEDGVIKVDERLSTGVPGIWVAGDARGNPMFTHTSWDDNRVLESQLLGNGARTTANRIVPYAIFTDPELGRVGLTEAEARKQFGDDMAVSVFEMKHNGRAVEEGEPGGFIKVVAEGKNGRLLGAAVLATSGSEIAASYVTLLNTGATVAAIRNGIYTHPTLSEAMQSAVSALKLKKS